jgi:Initiator Replication protein
MTTDTHVIAITEGANRVAVRRNELVLGHFRLSVWAQRLFLILVAHVDVTTTADTVFRFEVTALSRWLGVARTNLYTDLIPAIQELMRTTIRVERIDGLPGYMEVGLIQNKNGFVSASPTAALRLQDGQIEFFVHKELLPFVKALSTRFSRTELVYALRLRSSFSQKLYDVLKANRWRGSTFEVSMSELRALLAVDATEYAKFGDFRRTILEVAEREISQKTDIRFVWDAIKSGHRVTAIRFAYARAAGGNIEFLPDTTDDKLLQRLSRAGVKAETAAALVRRHGDSDPHRIIWHLDEALRQHKQGKLKNPAAWILSGITEDWRPQKPLFETSTFVPDSRRSEADDIQPIGVVGFAALVEGLKGARVNQYR